MRWPRGPLAAIHRSTEQRSPDRWLPGTIHAAALAADGLHLVTANANGTIYILRLAPRTTTVACRG
jgi:hypothetical protein